MHAAIGLETTERDQDQVEAAHRRTVVDTRLRQFDDADGVVGEGGDRRRIVAHVSDYRIGWKVRFALL